MIEVMHLPLGSTALPLVMLVRIEQIRKPAIKKPAFFKFIQKKKLDTVGIFIFAYPCELWRRNERIYSV